MSESSVKKNSKRKFRKVHVSVPEQKPQIIRKKIIHDDDDELLVDEF